jgi:peptidyl-prolyl cis-trans isomerase SurA
MKKNWILLMLITSFVSIAQNNDVLFTIDNNFYKTDEFLRIYNKNLDLVKDENQKDLNKYLELFIGYKLKVNKAQKLKLENDVKYKNELATYRTQLSKNYLTDTEVTESLIKEAYERQKTDINASHILINCSENAKPADTLLAFQKVMDIYNKLKKGDDFGKLAASLSEDPSAKENNGNLGYFSAFRMIYPFENKAYKTKKGEFSKPVRTRFGYHIIKVNDIRNNRGEITIAHIMIMADKKNEEVKSIEDKAKIQIDDIYKKLQQGEKFEDLAKQFSQDPNSAQKGGVLNKFSSGQISSEIFENTAFSLSKENEISQPFKSEYGWHIQKFIEKHPLKPLSELKKEITEKISRDDRSKKIDNSLTEKLYKKYKVVKNDKVYANTVKAVTPAYYKGEWKLPETLKPYNEVIAKISDLEIKGTQFLEFVNDQQNAPEKTEPLNILLQQHFKTFLDKNVKNYYNNNLENEFPEFANVMQEYKEGLLIFDLMEKEIWEKAKNDTVGLKKFHLENNKNYQWKKRYDMIICSSTDKKITENTKKMLEKGIAIDDIKKQLNINDKINIMFIENKFEEGNLAISKNWNFQKPKEIFQEGTYFYYYHLKNILPEGPKEFENCKAKVVNDYQNFLESTWIDSLKKEFKVTVNQDVFTSIKNNLKK